MRIAVLLLAIVAPLAAAQSWPSRPIRIITTLASGGGVDATARIVGQRLTDVWSQQVVVENRPGAGGTIASELVARAPADGYTLLMASSGHAITPSLYKLSYDVEKDFAPVTLVALAPNVLVVHPSVPVRSVKELVAFARAHPDQLLYSSSGNGSPAHLSLELLKAMTGVKMLHVPYKGTAPSVTDLIGGRVSATSASVVSTMPHVDAGRLRGLAVLSAKRAVAAPQVPTMSEAGVPGYEVDVWYALFAPAATPRDVLMKLYDEVARAIALPEIRDRMLGMGLEPVGNTPERFGAYVKSEVAKWGRLVRERQVKLN